MRTTPDAHLTPTEKLTFNFLLRDDTRRSDPPPLRAKAECQSRSATPQPYIGDEKDNLLEDE